MKLLKVTSYFDYLRNNEDDGDQVDGESSEEITEERCRAALEHVEM